MPHDLEQNDDIDPDPGKTSVRMGPAFLKWYDKEHLALYRPLIAVRNDEGEITRHTMEKPLGPLSVFRRAGKGDNIDLRTSDPRTGEPIELHLVWRPGMEGGPE